MVFRRCGIGGVQIVNKDVDNTKQCKKGDIFYRIKKDEVIQVRILRITHHELGHYGYEDNTGNTYFGHSFGVALFKTKEQAEDELYKRKRIKEKRKRLKDYELALNFEFGLKDHFIVK